jgi:DNA invertase Pin-like site-specific DNA recombinase
MDRLSREGTLVTLQHLDRLHKLGVDYKALQEAYLDTQNPYHDVFVALAATKAKEEKKRISERTKAGLARVKAAGKRLGRPSLVFDQAKASALLNDGHSKRAVAKHLNVPLSTLLRRLEVAV